MAADERLFGTTLEGRIYGFGEGATSPARDAPRNVPLATDEKAKSEVASILKTTGVGEGYCLVVGGDTEGLVGELLQQSKLQIPRGLANVQKQQRRLHGRGRAGKVVDRRDLLNHADV